ncbi:MAG: hypothetical protein JXQ91_07585 [Vannielia sp.]|uniref:hypothetical protein n=1 Tax=Vannielia sp. TaxID=2813045 RepID=UPI003B8D0C51
MRVLALDIASTTGAAVGDTGGAPKAWSFNLGKGSNGLRYARLMQMIWNVCKEHSPDLVAIEAPTAGNYTNQFLVGLAACAEGTALMAGSKVQVCMSPSIRKHFLGKHLTAKDFPHLKRPAAKKAIKGQVMARCALLGWEAEDDNAADALALWSYACAQHDPKFAYQHTPLFGGA